MGGTYHIRLIGGIVIWAFKGFRISLKDCINDFTNSFIVGIIIILVLFYFGIYLYSEVNQ